YGREYTVEAHYGRGSALLDLQQTQGAIDALHQALSLDPDHVLTRMALVRARIEQTVAVMATTRPQEASLMRARQLEACARLDESIEILERFLDQAPPGFAAWSQPID